MQHDKENIIVGESGHFDPQNASHMSELKINQKEANLKVEGLEEWFTLSNIIYIIYKIYTKEKIVLLSIYLGVFS